MIPRFLLGNGRADGGRHQASLGSAGSRRGGRDRHLRAVHRAAHRGVAGPGGAAGGLPAGLTGELVLQALRLTVITSVVSMVIVVVVGTPFALLLARRRSTLLRVIDTFVELPIVLPPVVAGVAMLMAFGRNGFAGARVGLPGRDLAVHHGGGDLCPGVRGGAVLHPGGAHRVRRRGPNLRGGVADARRLALGDVLAVDPSRGLAVAADRADAGLGAGPCRSSERRSCSPAT